MKRRGFTLIELMIVIAIIAVIAAIAIPNLLAHRHFIRPGDTVMVKSTHQIVTVVDMKYGRGSGYPDTYTCRIDNGMSAPVRFTEIHFFEGEIEAVPEQR